MAKIAGSSVLPVLALLVLCACEQERGADDYTAFVYAGCSQGRYDAGTQYAADVDTALAALANAAGYTAYGNYTSPSAAGLAALYQCRSDLPAAVCGGCVRSAASKLASLCNSAAGAAVQLRACFLRYGNDSFLGRQDTTVLFKKCGGEGGDAGVVPMRDAALGALVAAAAPAGGGGSDGSYRAGAAGYVQAMSQCVGDLAAKACSDCVSAAASQLKAGCGYASAGEVYLGKCYARFWSNAGAGEGNGAGINGGGGGGNGFSGGGVGAGNGYSYGFVPHTYGDVHDESGKTIAIIIGLVAAVALVIIFLTFVRRAGGVGGKS